MSADPIPVQLIPLNVQLFDCNNLIKNFLILAIAGEKTFKFELAIISVSTFWHIKNWFLIPKKTNYVKFVSSFIWYF